MSDQNCSKPINVCNLYFYVCIFHAQIFFFLHFLGNLKFHVADISILIKMHNFKFSKISALYSKHNFKMIPGLNNILAVASSDRQTGQEIDPFRH